MVTSPITSVYCKKTFTGLLTKLGLIRTLLDRTYEINSTWAGFHKDSKCTSLKFSRRTFSLPILLKGLLTDM